MCNPFLVTAGFTAASSLVQYRAQQQQAAAQQAYQQQLQIQTRNNAMAAYRNDLLAQDRRVEEERVRASQEEFENSLEAQRRRATARVSASESGVSGLSVDALLADFYRQEARLSDQIDYRKELVLNQSALNKKAAQTTAESRINSATPSPVEKPSALGTGLQIGAGVWRAGTKYKGWGKNGNMPWN